MKSNIQRAALALAVVLLIPAWVLSSPPETRVLDSGTTIWLRTNETINVKNAADGQTYGAVVSSDVVDQNGNVAIPRGSDAQLTLRREDNGQKRLELTAVTVNGTRYDVEGENTNPHKNQKAGVGKNKRTAKMVGGGAVLGTLLGAIAGGGKGAAIGAITGATAGGIAQQVTRGTDRIPAETRLHFRLDQPLRLESRS